MNKTILLKIESFFSSIAESIDDITNVLTEQAEWLSPDLLFDLLTIDIIDYLLYLSTDDIYVGKLNVIESSYNETLLKVLSDYNNDIFDFRQKQVPFNSILDFYIKLYNSHLKDSKIARNNKYPLGLQEEPYSIPMSFEHLKVYTILTRKDEALSLCVDFFNIYKFLGLDYLTETNNLKNIKRNGKYESFLNYLKTVTFSKQSLIPYLNNAIIDIDDVPLIENYSIE
jgi:hypothetical protein